jgi:hypothetical protein
MASYLEFNAGQRDGPVGFSLHREFRRVVADLCSFGSTRYRLPILRHFLAADFQSFPLGKERSPFTFAVSLRCRVRKQWLTRCRDMCGKVRSESAREGSDTGDDNRSSGSQEPLQPIPVGGGGRVRL